MKWRKHDGNSVTNSFDHCCDNLSRGFQTLLGDAIRLGMVQTNDGCGEGEGMGDVSDRGGGGAPIR